ncbi:MAG TPA: diguanylate cyclase [Syntrophales bacterium]|nr:diguanylate cyclase [Syntrophales bacterium]
MSLARCATIATTAGTVKFTISGKLLASYLAMALLAILASTYAIVSLHNLNELAYAIIDEDFFVVDTSKKMTDALLAQESAEKRYLIFKDPSIAEIFWSRSGEFKDSLDNLKKNNVPGISKTLSQVSTLHSRYDDLFNQTVTLVNGNHVDDATKISETESRKAIEDMATALREMRTKAETNIDARMNLIKAQGLTASRMTMALSAIGLFVGLSLALLITYNISRPLKELKKATEHIAEGKFEYNLEISRHDEIGSLADAFSFMTERLKILEGLLLDASPLTGLPGNIAIETEIQKRLSEKKQFSLCHVDLDNFKPFADKYGYAWGSEVIKEVAQIITENVHITEGDGDFAGHVGGDDFIIITEPERSDKVCRKIVEEFDRRSVKFYSEKDRQKGFIVGKDRQGVQQSFPLVTMTIAVVTDDGSKFQGPLDMAKRAAELKEYAKTLPGSNYVRQENVEKVS